MADTKISALAATSPAVSTHRIPIAISPFGAGNNGYITPVELAAFANTNAWTLASGGTLTGTNTIAAGANPLIITTGATTGTGATAGLQLAANSLTTGNALDISSSSVTSGFIAKVTSTTTAINHTAGTNALFGIVSTGANANSARTTVGQHVSVTNTGTTSVNIAAYFEASGAASTNIALRTGAGQVTLGNATPQSSTTLTVNTNSLSNSLSLQNAGSQIWVMTAQNITHTANQSTFAGTAHTIALSGSNNAAVTVSGLLFNGSMTQGASWTGDVAHVRVTSTYNTNASANGTFYGFDYNPTNTQLGTSTSVAFRNVTGSILHGVTTKSANTGTPVMVLGNAATNATGAQTDGIVIHAKDSSGGSANSTLALYTEEAPEATATFTQTHRIKIWWNGVEYYLPLDTV